MSTKTIKQRIALVAVSALTAGVLSVLSTPTANAGVADVTASSLWLATQNSATTDPVLTAAGGDTAADRSKGFLALTNTTGTTQANGTGVLAGVTATAVALQTSKLVFNARGTAAAITEAVSLSVSGGTITSGNQGLIAVVNSTCATNVVTLTFAAHGLVVGQTITVTGLGQADMNTTTTVATVPGATSITYAKTCVDKGAAADAAGRVAVALTFNGNANTVVRAAAAIPVIAAVVTPNAGATSITVSAYQGTGVSSTLPTNGTLLGSWVISLQAAAATDVYSPSLSAVAVTTTAGAATITTSVDASTSSVIAGNPLFIQLVNNNPYAQPLVGGALVATATNGALLNWGALAPAVGVGSATAAGTLSTAILLTGDGTDQLRVDPASSLATSTTTVTITHNGTPVTTKTLTFYGEVKTIKIESVKSGRTETAAAGGATTATAYAVYSYRDSAGGKVPGTAATFSALSATPIISTGVSGRAPSRSSTAAAPLIVTAALSAEIGVGEDGIFAFTCGSTSATTTVNITTTNPISLATITAPVTIACNGGFATYTVSTDKASYAVGEIATITIDAKDSAGNPVSENTALPVLSVSVGGGSLTAVIAGTELFTKGKRTVQAQMTTAGKFNTVVTIAGSVNTTATTGYAVTDGGVSNAQVLQSIVALIASINKQIQALQKLILKR